MSLIKIKAVIDVVKLIIKEWNKYVRENYNDAVARRAGREPVRMQYDD